MARRVSSLSFATRQKVSTWPEYSRSIAPIRSAMSAARFPVAVAALDADQSIASLLLP
jgi:hypothetical protein